MVAVAESRKSQLSSATNVFRSLSLSISLIHTGEQKQQLSALISSLWSHSILLWYNLLFFLNYIEINIFSRSKIPICHRGNMISPHCAFKKIASIQPTLLLLAHPLAKANYLEHSGKKKKKERNSFCRKHEIKLLVHSEGRLTLVPELN